MERYPTDFGHGEVSFSLDTKEFQRCSCRGRFQTCPYLISAANLPETTIERFSQALYNRENFFQGILSL